MDSNTTSSIIIEPNVDDNTTTTTTIGSLEGQTTVIVKKKGRGNRANLIPFVKGDSRINYAGKPKGTVQIKDTIRKKLNKQHAEAVADNIINGAIQGDDKKQDRLLKLTGDLDETPQVNIQHNTTPISAELLAEALEFLKQKNIQN